MKRVNLIAWIEVAATLSVLAGLILVAVELKQGNAHAQAESVRENFQAWAEIYRFESEYEIDLLVEKAVLRPDDLTDAELWLLDDYYSQVLQGYIIREYMEKLGLTEFKPVITTAPEIVDDFFYYPVAGSG